MANAVAYKGIEVRGSIEKNRGIASEYLTTNPLVESQCIPDSVIRPHDVKELQAILRVCDEGIVPVSSRGSHVRGGSACGKPHSIVDLSGWKKISYIDRRNRVCIVEPGVTYGVLTAALASHGMSIPMPLAPRSTKSVIASVVDREPATWPNKQWDYQDPVASTEFLFGTGDMFRTGAAGGPGTLEEQRKSGGAQKGPLGPGQTDYQRVVMGSQGTMGIVTWISLRTEVKPTVESTHVIGDSILDRLVPFLYSVHRPLLGEHSFILNKTAASMLMTHGDRKAYHSVRGSLPEFIALQNIAGFDRLPEERLAYQKDEILKKAKDYHLHLEDSVGRVDAKALLKTATSVCGQQDWRNVLKGNCLSIIFLSQLDRSKGLIDVLHESLAASGIDRESAGIYIQPVVQNRACHFEFMIPYDGSDEAEKDKMRSLERDLVERLMHHGAFFSRPYGAAVEKVFGDKPGHVQLMRLAKELFDPKGILNPGKFNLM